MGRALRRLAQWLLKPRRDADVRDLSEHLLRDIGMVRGRGAPPAQERDLL